MVTTPVPNHNFVSLCHFQHRPHYWEARTCKTRFLHCLQSASFSTTSSTSLTLLKRFSCSCRIFFGSPPFSSRNSSMSSTISKGSIRRLSNSPGIRCGKGQSDLRCSRRHATTRTHRRHDGTTDRRHADDTHCPA